MHTHNGTRPAMVFVSSVNKEMTYSDFVCKLFKQQTDDMEMLHAALGVCGEAGELGDAIKKHVIYEKELDRKNVVEELGDLRFYMQALMNKLGISEEELLQHNVEKLQERYKKLSYSNEAAIARADKEEENPMTIGSINDPIKYVSGA
jgi:NTP pyrophosphatase (non-canonical NTP hydrolase)